MPPQWRCAQLPTGPLERRQYLARHLPQIIFDKADCRGKLLEIACLPEIKRLDFLVKGFTRAGITIDGSE